MKRLLICAALVAAAGAFGQPASAQIKDDYSNKTLVGRQVFLNYGCGSCHAVGPKGKAQGPKGQLEDVGSRLSADELKNWVSRHNEMSAKADPARKPPVEVKVKLNDEEIEGLLVYLGGLKKK